MFFYAKLHQWYDKHEISKKYHVWKLKWSFQVKHIWSLLVVKTHWDDYAYSLWWSIHRSSFSLWDVYHGTITADVIRKRIFHQNVPPIFSSLYHLTSWNQILLSIWETIINIIYTTQLLGDKGRYHIEHRIHS